MYGLPSGTGTIRRSLNRRPSPVTTAGGDRIAGGGPSRIPGVTQLRPRGGLAAELPVATVAFPGPAPRIGTAGEALAAVTHPVAWGGRDAPPPSLVKPGAHDEE